MTAFHTLYHSASSHEARHAFILHYVSMSIPHRRRPRVLPGTGSPRALAIRYYVPHTVLRTPIQVCRVSFVDVLGISRHMMDRVTKCFFMTGQLPVDGRGGDRRSVMYAPKRASVMNYLNSYRENELNYNEGPLLTHVYCIKSLWKNYSEIADDDVQVRYSLFRQVFIENFDLNLNPKNQDTSFEEFTVKNEEEWLSDDEPFGG